MHAKTDGENSEKDISVSMSMGFGQQETVLQLK